jgi:hypothetical protein
MAPASSSRIFAKASGGRTTATRSPGIAYQVQTRMAPPAAISWWCGGWTAQRYWMAPLRRASFTTDPPLTPAKCSRARAFLPPSPPHCRSRISSCRTMSTTCGPTRRRQQRARWCRPWSALPSAHHGAGHPVLRQLYGGELSELHTGFGGRHYIHGYGLGRGGLGSHLVTGAQRDA